MEFGANVSTELSVLWIRHGHFTHSPTVASKTLITWLKPSQFCGSLFLLNAQNHIAAELHHGTYVVAHNVPKPPSAI